MAARKNPSAGAKPDKLMRDALMLELNTETTDEYGKKVKKYRRIAANLVRLALDNKMDAIKEVNDRVDGKAVQGVALTGEGGGPVQFQTIQRAIVHTKN